MSLRAHLLFTIIAIAAVAVAAALTPMMLGSTSLVRAGLENQTEMVTARLQRAVAAEAERALAQSAIVAALPATQKAVAEQDRATLEALFLPGMATLKKEFGVRQFQFHTPDAHSLFRVHKPEKFGDDLSGFRRTVVEANAKKKSVLGLERGRAGVGVRGVSPISYQGKHVGSVEIGLSFDQGFFDAFVGDEGFQVEFYELDDEGVATFDNQGADGVKRVAATFEAPALLTPAQVRAAAHEGHQEFEIGGASYASAMTPIRDFSGARIGVAHILIPTAEYAGIQEGIFWQTAVVGLLCLAGAAGAAFFFGGRISKSLEMLVTRMRKLSQGDASIDIPGLERRDEIGQMAGALQVFKETKQRMDALAQEKAEADAAALAARAEMMAQLQSAFGAVVDAAVAGDFSRRVPETFEDPEIRQLATGVNQLVETVSQGVSETARLMARLAESDLTDRMRGAFQGEFAALQRNANDALTRLSDLLRRISETSAVVSNGAAEITDGAKSLSQRAEQQASSLEETAATMEEISASIKSNAESAMDATNLANEALDRASKGQEVVSRAVAAMSEIETSASQIAEIISVIDGIAFQTNLLALNAAVEAARAGDAGKGFAVVASEVRSLAQRSSAAARDIRGLIQTSVNQVAGGSRLVGETGESFGDIVEAIRKAEAAMGDIATASREQASGVEEISSAVSHMDGITQQNAAMADASASGAMVLSDSAQELAALIAAFKIDAEADRGAAAA